MKATKRERKYFCENFNEVLHTTLNPEGPGVVRIHLVPPKYEENEIVESIVILNGQDIVPINKSWAILLAEFIKVVNNYDGKEVSEEDLNEIMKLTKKGVRKIYPLLGGKLIENDLYTIMNAFKQIAYDEPIDEEIGYLSLGEYAPFMRAPHRMDIMVSAMTKEGKWHCNQKCVHCYAAGQVNAEEAELSTEDWKKILDKCREVGIPQVTFTGGEPTMRDDLVELVDYSRWFVTRLNTNGIKITKELAKELHAASLDSMQITFYSENEEIHNKLVGAAQYKSTVEGIENALSAGISLSINTPLCTLNKDYVKTLEFLHSKGVMFVTCSGLITTGNATTKESENLQLSREEIKQILKDAADYCYANGMEISFTSPGWIEEEFFCEIGVTTPNCGAGLSNMAITPSGNVVACQSWLSGDSFGNMLTDSWESIWNNERCVMRREYSSKMLGECPLRIRKEDSNENN